MTVEEIKLQVAREALLKIANPHEDMRAIDMMDVAEKALEVISE